MNWKNVVHLIRVDMKSGRLIRGQRLTKYREKRLFTYLLYGGVLAGGLIVGGLVGLAYNALPEQRTLFREGALSVFLALPTLILIYSLVFTMMQQIQRSGVRASVQAPYWLPITWGEHTLASILTNLLGFLLASIIFISSAILVFSAFSGQIGYAVLTVITLLASAFMASAITEALRVLQVRFIGAVYKSSGRAAVWVRFAGSLIFFIVFYIVYFTLTTGAGTVAFVQTIASAQSAVWFIPFVWIGLTLYSIVKGLLVQAIGFAALSVLFILALFYATLALNRRFGLYEPPAITVSRGVYAPRMGFLGRLGFSTVEAAVIRKDLKAFTRRRELMYIFIVPIVFILIPLMQSFSVAGAGPIPSQVSVVLFATVTILPSLIMALSIGNLMIGEEGGAVWRIYAAPISAKSLVKSKYFFIVFFAVLIAVITSIVGTVIFHPSIRATLTGFIESLLLIFALGAISLANGIKGADFTEVPRPRMIRTSWSFINLIACFLSGLAILAPIGAYELVRIIPFPFARPPSARPPLELYQAVIISAFVAVVIAYAGYRLALRNARDLLTKAEI